MDDDINKLLDGLDVGETDDEKIRHAAAYGPRDAYESWKRRVIAMGDAEKAKRKAAEAAEDHARFRRNNGKVY